MHNENCPCCPNHCEKDALKCDRGKDYYNNINHLSKEKTLDEKIILDLRKCGHMLHHNKELDVTHLLINVTDNEKEKLHELLSKIVDNISR